MKKYIQQLKKVFVATKNLPPTFRLIWSTSRQLTLILCILTCLQGVMPTVMIWIGKYVLDEMVIVLQAPNTENIAKLAYLILLQITATLFSLCIARLTKYTNTMFANVLDMSITGRTMKKAVHLDLSYFEIPSFYDKSHRARTEASSRSMTILMNTFLIMQYVVSFIAMVTVLIPLGWILITLAFLTSFPSLFVGIKLGRAGYQLEWDRTQKVRLMGYISSLLMGSHAAKEVRSLGIGDYLYNKWETEKKRYISQNRRIERKRFVGYLLSEGISLVGLAAATAYIIYRAILSQGGVTIGAVMMYISAFSNVRISLNAILNTLSQTYSNSLFIQNLLDFLALQPKIFSCSNALPIPARIEMIEFKNVCFKYPLAKDYALYDVCLTMKRGESILLTGANGAGKSTFVKLLMRLYDPTEGEITINGINLKSYDLTLLRQAFV